MCLRTIYRKLALELIVIFNSVTDISFLKYFTMKSGEKFGRECFKCCKCLASEEANQLQVLYMDFGKYPRKLLASNPILLKLWSSNVSQKFFFWNFPEVLGVSHILIFVRNPHPLLYTLFPTWFNLSES